jgi:SnoaL-like domain
MASDLKARVRFPSSAGRRGVRVTELLTKWGTPHYSRVMAFTADDRLAIHEVVSLHGHLFDNGELERRDEVFTSDAVYDASEFVGELPVIGHVRDTAAAMALGDRNPLGHHVTNKVGAAPSI